MRKRISCRIFGIRQVRGNMNIPIGEGLLNGIKPSGNTSFTAINFLTTSHQANDDSPINMAIQIGD